MFKERRLPWWARLTSAMVVGALLAGCGGKTYGYVTPTADQPSPTPTSEPYCDTHMFTVAPDLGIGNLDASLLPIMSENLMGPSGVGEITGISMVKNPKVDFIKNVKSSAKAQGLDLNPEKSQVVEFGMEGKNAQACAPFTMILGEEKPDGTRKSYVGFDVAQIDSNKDNVPDLEVLIPSFDGNIDRFVELGEVDPVAGDGETVLGAVDQLDPESVTPLFSVNQKTGKVVFFPPFYQGDTNTTNTGVEVENGANFVEVSYHPNGSGVEVSTPTITPNAVSTKAVTETSTPVPTKEVKQYPICTPEKYADCVVPYQDLFNGNYLNWLKSLPVDQFDPAKVEIVQCYGNSHELTFVGNPNKNNFSNPETAMVRRGITYGVTTLQPGEVGYDFPQSRSFLILPTFSYSKSLNTGVWNIFVYRIDGNSTSQTVDFIKNWAKAGNLLVISNQFESGIVSDNPYFKNPLVVNSFSIYPDLQTKLDNFGENCDPGYISDKGIVLETSYSR